MYRLVKMNREKKHAAEIRHKKSVEQFSNLPSVYEEADKQVNPSSERAMARED